MGLYERLIAEFEAEDRERVFPQVREPQLLERLVMRGPTSAATGMRLASLRKRYPNSYNPPSFRHYVEAATLFWRIRCIDNPPPISASYSALAVPLCCF
jgi:hypothetical protein